ncbi:MAG TPA: tetratricopeptide repeat protein [Phycisphaerae bacterium]|nr:tetratricopeptide repeat protein [Phycisphaerae bacterium]
MNIDLFRPAAAAGACHGRGARFLTAAIVLTLPAFWLLPGCAATAQKSAATKPAKPVAVAGPPLLGSEPSAGGLFEAVDTSRPLTGDALMRAEMSRAEILQSVQQFTAGDLSASAAPATQPAAATQPDHDPPAQAVKYYLQGRSLFLDGSNSAAMDALEKSLALDPNAFTVLRLMGRVCFAASQLARGSVYLQRAYRLAPDDMEVNYLLGRYYLERKDNDRAVFYLLNADRVMARGEAQAPLISFYLGRALQDAHYHAAAAQALDEFLAEAALPVPGYRYDRELSYLLEEQWAGDLEAAENEVAIGAWKKAAEHFKEALAGQPDDSYIASRLMNAEVHAEAHAPAQGLAAARQTALGFINTAEGSADAMTLLVWAYRAAREEPAMIPELRTALAGTEPARRAAVLASAYDALGQKGAAFDTLRSYLEGAPQDRAALARLLNRVETPGEFSAALRAAAAAIAADPTAVDSVEKQLAHALDSDAAAAWAISPPRDVGGGIAAYLAAEALESNDAGATSIDAAFRAALRGAPEFFPARRGYVEWLISEDRFSDAQALVEEALGQPQAGLKAAELKVTLLAGEQRLTDALAAAQEAAKKFPEDAGARLEVAAVYRARGQTAEAERELTSLLEAQPGCGPAYEALINSLLARVRQPESDGSPGGSQRALTDAVSWLGRLVAAVPSSIFGEVTTATLYTQVGRSQEAETMMARAAAEHPGDADVLITLARVRQANGKSQDAAAGLETALAADPSPALAAGLAQLYRTQGKPDEAAALVQRLAREHSHQPGYALAAADELAQQKKAEAALAVLQTAAGVNPRSQELAEVLARRLADAGRADEGVAALESFIGRNGETSDRLYELSHLYSRAGREAQAEETLKRVLAILPTHTGAANDLGYSWADAGTHLDEAEALITKALAEEPGNGAFLDSMGWVLYKRGKFADALTYLQRALPTPDGQTPDVVDHVADALYRAGRTGEAAERWRQAQSMLDESEGPLSKDEQALKNYLEQVLSAVNSGTSPNVTPTAQSPAPRAATR